MVHLKNNLLLAAVARFGTPLYAYDFAGIRENYATLKASFGGMVEIVYSIKANPNVAIAAGLQSLGAGVEVCSRSELELALHAGFQPEQIVFVGPAKTRMDLERVIQLGIDAIVCESKEEFSLINELASARGVVANVAMRINPVFTVKGASLKMGGVASQFGMDQEEVLANKEFFLSKKQINIVGIHVFNGTRILDADVFVENTLNILALAEKITSEWQLEFSLLDIGGGIGVPYFEKEHAFDFAKLTELLNPHLHEYKTKNKNTRIVLESGRYLVASAGYFISRVVNIKSSRDITYLITDGGMNCHLTAAGYGSMIKQNFPVSLLSYAMAAEQKCYHIAGPLCTPADVIGRHVSLPEAQVGDCVVFHASGAYGASASPTQFLGHGYPAEVLMLGESVKLVRKRDSVKDILRNQNLITKRPLPAIQKNDLQMPHFTPPSAVTL